MLIFFYGQDDYRISVKIKSVKDRFINTVDPKSFSIEEIEGENIEYSDLKEKTLSSSLFTKKRLLIINNIFANKKAGLLEELIGLLKKTKEQDINVLCFVEKDLNVSKFNLKQKKLFTFLSQEKYSQEFKLLNNPQLLTYAKKLFIKQKISDNALRLLISKTGSNLWKLNNEANKLISLKKEEINISDIEDLIIGQSESNIFALCDAFANQDKALSFNLLNEEIENNNSLEYILSMLIRQFKILIEVKSDNNRSSANQMSVHPYVLSKSKNQIHKFKISELLVLFDKLVDIEQGYKKGKLDLKKALLAMI